MFPAVILPPPQYLLNILSLNYIALSFKSKVTALLQNRAAPLSAADYDNLIIDITKDSFYNYMMQ